MHKAEMNCDLSVVFFSLLLIENYPSWERDAYKIMIRIINLTK